MRKVIVLFFLLPILSNGQSRYFVYLKDKQGTAYSINNPQAFLSEKSISRRTAQNIVITETDLPPSNTYVNQIKDLGFAIIGKSKWLNAVLVEGSSDKFNDLRNLSCVSNIEDEADIRGNTNPNARIRAKQLTPPGTLDYGSSATQINMIGADTMHLNGYRGSGVLIGVMDAGFPGVNTGQVFADLRNDNRIVKTYNYVFDIEDVYRDNNHGTSVLSTIVGYLPGSLVGTAPDASVALYTTEDSRSESKQEEVFWVLAAENADSLGVDVINTSLGYSLFDDPNQDYTYSEMDGKTTIITRAADYAALVGIIVVNSAGNSGNDPWRYITAPSDGVDVISVGAVNASKVKAGFSSFGPSADGRVKPDVCAMGQGTIISSDGTTVRGGNGTSFSSPVIAGFMASLKSQFPTLTALQLRDILIRSADRYTAPNDSYGYGIPSYTNAVDIANRLYLPPDEDCGCLSVKIYPNPSGNSQGITIKIGDTAMSPEMPVTLIRGDGKVIEKEIKIKDLNSVGLPTGSYLINFNFSGKNYIQKLLIGN